MVAAATELWRVFTPDSFGRTTSELFLPVYHKEPFMDFHWPKNNRSELNGPCLLPAFILLLAVQIQDVLCCTLLNPVASHAYSSCTV